MRFAIVLLVTTTRIVRSTTTMKISDDSSDDNNNEDWVTCGGLETSMNRTACPSSRSTCCKQSWSPSEGNWGCSNFLNATCCENGYTSCPEGYRCVDTGSGWGVSTACTKKETNETVSGQQVCKQGAPIPFDATRKNVLILGDSVSIGYTPFVASQLQSIALVQHTPWGGDGGAEETAYGWQCLDYLLRAPNGKQLRPDMLYFNFGLHNTVDPVKNPGLVIPGQSGLDTEYMPYLRKIVKYLHEWAGDDVKLLFALTSPMMNSKAVDDIVLKNNAQAQELMNQYNITTIDLHTPIVKKCGPVPQSSCMGIPSCWSPHCPQGYEWLANSTVTPAIRNMLLIEGGY